MTTSSALDEIRSRILSRYALLFLKTWEEERWETELAELALEIERGLVVWSVTGGALPPPVESGDGSADPLAFLEQVEAYPPDHLFLIKDFHPYLEDPRVLRKLRDLTQTLADQNKTLLLMGPVIQIPVELQKEAFEVDLPLPNLEELRVELQAVLASNIASSESPAEIAPVDEERLLQAVLGLTAREAHKALRLALQGHDAVDDDVLAALVAEKRHLVQGSDLLEFYDLDEGVKDVGGLEVLKDWLRQRAEAFSERAREQGIPMPRGVLLLGIQGCGKSLTARAAARLLSFPLVRMDVANLLSSDRGTSERNLRDVLRLMETIAPAVLWLDEIEKGFAGVGTDADTAQDATMSRLVGSFLTWMEARKAPVFVVATANSVANLPPEMLRRGRFDELFFVDLPNYHERRQILSIHLAKRGWKPEKYDLGQIAGRTEGFSGAELEQIVISAMIDAYGQGRVLSQEDIDKSREQTVPLSVTMEEKVFELREWASTRCRRATSDSRVTQMLEEEQRHAALLPDDDGGVAGEAWVSLAEHGQLNAAVIEYLRKNGRAIFPQLQQDFAKWLPPTGELGLALRSDPNVVVWAGMGKAFTDLLAALISARRIYLHPCPPDCYKQAGKILPFPLVAEIPDERLARPGWLPSLISVVPPKGGSGRLARIARIKISR
ncbi:MAG TPA: AAA family ATPase [Planctomycetaceae bacterium]|nr:AAA family ATPase [Planctomycetaceae bacterium]